MNDDILVIDMNGDRPGACWNCGKECSGDNCGLPINENAELVSNDFQGEWGGVPCCRECYERHERGELPVADEYVATVWGTVQVGR